MTDKIGPDGLTDKERLFRNTLEGVAGIARTLGTYSPSDDAALMIVRALAAERLAHAQTRAERDRLRAALEGWTRRYGSALCPGPGDADTFGDGVRAAKAQVRAILGEVKP